MSNKKEEKVPTREVKHYAIIPLMVASAMDKIIAVLVKRGYTVAPLASSKKAYISEDGNLTTILALDLKKTIPDDGKESRTVISDDLKDVLKVTSTRYYMLVVGEVQGMFTWMIGNVTTEVDAAVTVPAGPYRSPGNLN
jgi:hypothetical protein